jgi:hypothetical protein
MLCQWAGSSIQPPASLSEPLAILAESVKRSGGGEDFDALADIEP